MIDAQLGPPVAVVSRGGTAPTGGAGGENAMAAQSPADDGGFTAALESRRTAADSSDARPARAHTPRDAAGPQTGELQEEVAAEAGASQEETAVEQVAAAIAAVVTAALPTVASPTPPSGALAAQQAVEAVQAGGPPQPIAGLVPALLDGDGGVVPALTAAQAQTTTPVAGQVPAVASATAQALTAQTANAAALAVPVAPTAAPADSGATPAPAAMLTLTITSTASQTSSDATPDQGLPATVVPPSTPTPVLAADDAPAPIPTLQPQLLQTAATAPAAEPPAGTVAPAPAPPLTHADPLAGIVRPSGGMTTPHELGRELGTRVHMAVREGGRELVVNLRPADMGHLTIRVTMTDGVMQAQIIAERPEAARMLQQSLGHLDTALGDLGYSLDNLDIAYGGEDPRDAMASRRQSDGSVTGEVLEADGSPAVPGTPSSAAAGSPARLDILA
jgi:chemotaxis protein MotD